MPVQFDTNRARVVVKDKGVNFTGTFSKETKQFVDNRYVVLRKFIPQDLIDLTLDTWKTIENDCFHTMSIKLGNRLGKWSMQVALTLRKQ